MTLFASYLMHYLLLIFTLGITKTINRVVSGNV